MSFVAVSNIIEATDTELTTLQDVKWTGTTRFNDSRWEVGHYNGTHIYRLKLQNRQTHYMCDGNVNWLLVQELNARNAYIDVLEAKLECMPCDQTWADCQEAVANEIKLINKQE